MTNNLVPLPIYTPVRNARRLLTEASKEERSRILSLRTGLSYFIITDEEGRSSVDITMVKNTGQSAIQYVRSLDQLKFLHEGGADLNHLDENKRKSILEKVINKRSIPMIEYLLEHGANPNTRGVRRVLLRASDEIFTLLVKGGLRLHPFFVERAIRGGYVERLQLMKELGWDISTKRFGHSPPPLISFTALADTDVTAHFLMREGHDINQVENGMTVLHIIATNILMKQQSIDELEREERTGRKEYLTHLHRVNIEKCIKQYKRLTMLGADPTMAVPTDITIKNRIDSLKNEPTFIEAGSTPLDILPTQYQSKLKPAAKGAHCR